MSASKWCMCLRSALMTDTRLTTLNKTTAHISKSGSPRIHGAAVLFIVGISISDRTIKEYILRSKSKGMPSLLDGIEDQFNASVPGRNDMIFVPVDILLDLNIKARFDFLRSELSRTDVIFEDGTKSISCVSAWEPVNSCNPNMYLLPENRERRDKNGKLYTERLAQILDI